MKRAGKRLRRISPDGADKQSLKNEKRRTLFRNKEAVGEPGTDLNKNTGAFNNSPSSNPSNNTESNDNIRLLQLYFKEMGEISLLSSKQELIESAKIRKCANKTEEIKNKIEKVFGRKLGKNIKEVVNGINYHKSKIKSGSNVTTIIRKK